MLNLRAGCARSERVHGSILQGRGLEKVDPRCGTQHLSGFNMSGLKNILREGDSFLVFWFDTYVENQCDPLLLVDSTVVLLDNCRV